MAFVATKSSGPLIASKSDQQRLRFSKFGQDPDDRMGNKILSPGPGTEMLVEEGGDQEIRSAVAKCSPKWPDFLAIESKIPPTFETPTGSGDMSHVLIDARGPRWQDNPSFLIGDCPYYRAALLSMLKDGDLNIKNNLHPRQYPAGSNVALGVNGAWYPKHPILMPFAAIPFYLVAHDREHVALPVVEPCVTEEEEQHVALG